MAIKTIAAGFMLESGAANSYLRARRAGCPAGITSALREHQLQVKLFHENYTTDYAASAKHDPRGYDGRTYWRRKVATHGGTAVSVAIPGSRWSNHENGLSLDLPEPARTWMRKHGHKHGWIPDLAPGEPWHFEYQADKDRKRSLAIIPTFNAAVRREWQRQLGVDDDSIFGDGSVSRLQWVLNRKNGHGGFRLSSGPLDVDGVDGSRTWKAVQKLLNAWAKRGLISLKRPLKVNGKRDARTLMALRKSLNANLWE